MAGCGVCLPPLSAGFADIRTQPRVLADYIMEARRRREMMFQLQVACVRNLIDAKQQQATVN